MPGWPLMHRRTTDVYAMTDMLFYGEFVVDTTNKRFGVSSGYYILVYPEIRVSLGKMVLEQDFVFKSDKNPIEIHFNTPNALKITDGDTVIANINQASQTFSLASDAVVNRGGVQSLEVFSSGYSTEPIPLVYTGASYKKRNRGNLRIVAENVNTDLDTAISFQNLLANEYVRGIRDDDDITKGTHLFSKGGIFIGKTTASQYLEDVSLRSYMFYPNASDMELTFYMMYGLIEGPIELNTRIGYPGNYQYYSNTLTSEVGALLFNFDPTKVFTANKGKPIQVDWFFRVSFGHDLLVSVPRGLYLSNHSVFPGILEIDDINPSFDISCTEQYHNQMYDPGDLTANMFGSGFQYVNFPVPLVTDKYEVIISEQDYPVEISTKTRGGMLARSTLAPNTNIWNFNYNVICNG